MTPRSDLRKFCYHWIWLLSVIALTLMPGRACAVEITEQAYWDDHSHDTTWAQAKEQTFTVSTGLISRGYATHPTWIRLRIAPSKHNLHSLQPTQWVLRMRPSFLDTIELYDPAQSSNRQTATAITGDRHPLPHTAYRSINHSFIIPASTEARHVWLRLDSSSSHVMLVDVYSLEEAIAEDRQQDAFNVALITLQVVFLLWAMMSWWSTRDNLLLWFIHKQLWILPYLLFIHGYARALWGETLPPTAIDQLTNGFVLIYTAAAFLFDRQLIKSNGGPRWGIQAATCILLASPIALALLWLGQASLAMQVNILLVTCAPLLVLSAVLAIPSRPTNSGQFSKWLLATYYSLVSAPLLMTALALVGLTKGFQFSLDALYIHTVLSGLLLMAMLLIRTRSLELERIKTLGELAVAERQAAEQRSRREDMAKFFSMLTHELRTPLAVIKMVLPSPDHQTARGTPEHYIHRAVQDIDNLIDRCSDAEKIDNGTLKVRPQPCDLVDELHNCLANVDEERLRLSCTLETAALTTDPKHLHNILLNLLSNALRYSPAKSMIDVELSRFGDAYRVSVGNVSSDEQLLDTTKVFSKYYRSPSAHRLSGAGLGLYVVRHLAMALGGSVALEQSSADRVTFHLYLKAL